MSGNILRQIVETKCAEVDAARRARPDDQMRAAAQAAAPPRDFYAAVTNVAQPPSALSAAVTNVAQPPSAVTGSVAQPPSAVTNQTSSLKPQAFGNVAQPPSAVSGITVPPAWHRPPAHEPSSPPHLIAEIKKSSPSAGLIRPDFDPLAIARAYAASGAAALSVLTDRTYFSGDLSFIDSVKRVVALPVLRKDFIVDEYQIHESRAAGADAILLIAAILTAPQIESCAALAERLGMTTLIEVHDEEELSAVQRLLDPRRRILVGINNRNLATQTIDLSTTARLAARLPPGTPFVAESGLKTRDDVRAVRCAGACAVLIGESLLRADNIAAAVREILRP